VITQLNDDFYNFGDIRVAGFDADMSYAVDTRVGRFTPSLAIANIYKWVSAVTPGSPQIDGVQQSNELQIFGGGVGWSPRWKGTRGAGVEPRAALHESCGPLPRPVSGRSGVRTEYSQDRQHLDLRFNARYHAGQALARSESVAGRRVRRPRSGQSAEQNAAVIIYDGWYDIQEYNIRGRYLHLDMGLRF